METEKLYILTEGQYSEQYGRGEIQVALRAENPLEAVEKMQKVLTEDSND